MPAEPDDDVRDPTLRRAIAELRTPVTLDADLDRRALAEIRAGRPSAPWPIRLAWLGGALAAGIALVLLARAPAPPAATPASFAAAETRPVRLQLAAPASRVAVVGDFNDWDPAATPLRRAGDGATWTVELHLKPGRYHYTFLIDGRRWASDPAEPRAAESDFGAPMSVLTVS
jgi:Glycogen recognition site of AMP-activated protein kinase